MTICKKVYYLKQTTFSVSSGKSNKCVAKYDLTVLLFWDKLKYICSYHSNITFVGGGVGVGGDSGGSGNVF